MTFRAGRINPARLCAGLSKIGYMPASAICDIIDNSVRADAKHVYVRIEPEREAPDTRLNNVKEYLVIDDGIGMTRDELDNAVALGSDDNYEPHSLSKFGLGLKSASFSQGQVLEIVSSPGNAPFNKVVVSLPEIEARGEYGFDETELSEHDERLIGRYLPERRGTIVRIAHVHKNNHPSIKSTLSELLNRVGTIYYYKMLNNQLEIAVNDEACRPFDVLFTAEANETGNLDENTWNGRQTRWIEKPRVIQVDAAMGVEATIEVTQLPYPPMFDLEGTGRQKEIRDRYRIGAGNYGFYVYRNGRLLSWAESFGIIPQDQDYYAFRGRILIDDSADETFNIDVKKSHIHLSSEAFKVIDDLSSEYKRKSKRAWKHAKDEMDRLTGGNPLERTNTLAQTLEMPEELPGDLETEHQYKESERREEEIVKRQSQRLRQILQQELDGREQVATGDEEGRDGAEPSTEEVTKAVGGDAATPTDRVFLVDNTEDNALWEPYYDTDKGPCVRLNRLHRFSRVIFDDNSSNGALQILMSLLFLELSGAEGYVQRTLQKYDRSQIMAILQEYRRVSTEYLAKMCRDLEASLPSE